MLEIIVVTFRNLGEPSSNPVRVKPLPGQLKGECRVWCSVAQRESHPVGSLFKVFATWVLQDGRDPYLRISRTDRWVQVSEAQANAHIAGLKAKQVGSS
jgi:hypothetical protein